MRYRVALLALYFSVPALAQSVPPAQAQGATTVDAEAIEGVGDLEVTARGNAEIRRDDVTIFGDLLRYNAEFGRVQGEGGVRLQRDGDRFYGPRLQFNTLEDSGTVESPRYLIQREATAHGGAEEVEIIDHEHYRMKKGSFTTCEVGRDDWVLQASEIDLDYDRQVGTAKQPRLRFYDVPIFAFPYATFPLENSRRSGVLSPYYAQTSQRGLEFGVPYYWNIAPEADLTVTPVYMSKRGIQLKNWGRYLQPNYQGEMRLEYLPDDKVFGATRSGVSWQHAQTFAPNFTGNLDYNKVSDDRYFTDLASQVRIVSIGNLQQDGYVTYSGSVGRFPYGVQARVQGFQALQAPLAPIDPPYHRVPQLTFNSYGNNLAGHFDTTLPAELVRFTHDVKVEGTRASVNPYVSMPFLAPSWFVSPQDGFFPSRLHIHPTKHPPHPPPRPTRSRPHAHAARHDPRVQPGQRTGVRAQRALLRRHAHPDARAAPVLREGALPQPGRVPRVRHGARRLQLHPAVQREPLHRRRPLRRCQPVDARHELALPHAERDGGPAGHPGPALVFRGRALAQ